MARKSERELERTLADLEESARPARFDGNITDEDRELLCEFFGGGVDPEVKREVGERLHEMGPIEPGGSDDSEK